MDSDLGNLILAEAVKWLGTPYAKSEAVRGEGVDCLHFIGGVLRDLGILTRIPERDYNYGFWRTPGVDLIREGVEEAIKLLAPGFCAVRLPSGAPREPGDFVCFAQLPNDDRPTHVAWVEKDLGHSLIVLHAPQNRHQSGGRVERTRRPPSWRIVDHYVIKRSLW